MANKEHCNAVVAARRAANTEATRIQKLNRRGRASGGKLSKGLSVRLFKLQRGKCACCGQPLGTDYHLDHIMPLALGGSNTDENIQLLRATCNRQKNAKHPIDFTQQRGFLL
jgi:5-methylcytosine-specific restriction endonuclease McrA